MKVKQDLASLANADFESAMSRAFFLAGKGPSLDTNPQVGCVVLDPLGNIVAEGFHLGAGTDHAEVAALNALPPEWRKRMGDLTFVVTLEPCNHVGLTPPCARTLAEAGVGAVAFSVTDPGQTSGGGAQTLRSAGTAIHRGILEQQGLRLLSGWLQRKRGAERARQEDPQFPLVTLKLAQTLDGFSAAADGSSQWITGPTARHHVHRARAMHDAIMIGTGTLLADNPSLTARDESGNLLVSASEQPVPIVVGGRQIPDGSLISNHPALAARGMDCPIRLSGVDLREDLAGLTRLGIRSIYVEGGPTLLNSLLRDGICDEIHLYIGGGFLGSGRPSIGNLGIFNISGLLGATIIETINLCSDLFVRARLLRGDEG